MYSGVSFEELQNSACSEFFVSKQNNRTTTLQLPEMAAENINKYKHKEWTYEDGADEVSSDFSSQLHATRDKNCMVTFSSCLFSREYTKYVSFPS